MAESDFTTPPLGRKRSQSTRSVKAREDYSPVPKKQLRPIAGRGIAPRCFQAVGSKAKTDPVKCSSADTSDVAYWWLFVLEFLSVHDAANFGRTSRSHRALFQNEILWSAFLERDFGIRRAETIARHSGLVRGRTACALCAEDLAETEWRKVLFDKVPVHACPENWGRSKKSASGLTLRSSCHVDIYSMRRCAAVDLSPENRAVALRLGPSLHRLYAWCTVCKFTYTSRSPHCAVVCADSSEAEWLNAKKIQCHSCRRQFFTNTVVDTAASATSSSQSSTSDDSEWHDHEVVGGFSPCWGRFHDKGLAANSPFKYVSHSSLDGNESWWVWRPSPKFFGRPVRITPCRAEVVQCASCGNYVCEDCSVDHGACCKDSRAEVAGLGAARLNGTCSLRKMR